MAKNATAKWFVSSWARCTAAGQREAEGRGLKRSLSYLTPRILNDPKGEGEPRRESRAGCAHDAPLAAIPEAERRAVARLYKWRARRAPYAFPAAASLG